MITVDQLLQKLPPGRREDAALAANELTSLITATTSFLVGFNVTQTELDQAKTPEEREVLTTQKTARRAAGRDVLAALAELIINGTTSADTLKALLVGGIVYGGQNVVAAGTLSLPKGGVSPTTSLVLSRYDPAAKQIVLYETLFQKTVGADGNPTQIPIYDVARVIRHDLAHAYLLENGLVYNVQDLVDLAYLRPNHPVDPTAVQPHPDELQNPSPLPDVERQLLEHILSESVDRQSLQTPFVCQVLQNLPDRAATPPSRLTIENELLAETLGQWLAVVAKRDGQPRTFGERYGHFVWQRLLGSQALATVLAAQTPESQVDPTTKPAGKRLEQFLLVDVANLTDLQSIALAAQTLLSGGELTQNQSLQQLLGHFLTHSLLLAQRFERLLGPDQQKKIAGFLSSRAQPLQPPTDVGNAWETPGARVLPTPDLPAKFAQKKPMADLAALLMGYLSDIASRT